MSIKQALKNIRNERLIVTPRFEQHLLLHDGVNLPDDVMAVIAKQMTAQPRNRVASFSCSTAGACHRKQVYQFLGYPAPGPADPRVNLLFLNGHYTHLMVQALMLHAGIIDKIEVPLDWPKKYHRGTMDGTGHVPSDHPIKQWQGQEFILEVKGINEYTFKQCVKLDSPDLSYKKQVAKYMVVSGIDIVVIFYVNKNTQEYREWVYTRDDLKVHITAVKDEIDALAKSVDTKTLPPRLGGALPNWIEPECQRCPYGGNDNVCANVTKWGEYSG